MTHTSPRSHCRTPYWPSRVRLVARLPMKTHNFRVPENVWKDAIATADAAGENFADRLREFTEWYGRQPHSREPRRPARAVRAPAEDS